MKRYLRMEDTRPLDDWGLPIGPSYEKKDWDQLTPDEMMADFEWKSDVLASFGEEVQCDTFYQDYLFRELYEGKIQNDYDYKVILTEYDAEESKKVYKLDVEDIHDFLHLNDVALSPCLFYGNWRMKALLNYISAFVLDIDKLRPKQLQRFIQLFDEGRLLRPTFIANSGSGVHFYYLLDKMLRCDAQTHEANNLIAAEIYKCLYDDVIKKEKWKHAQRHWVGQDYRVVNSKTKLYQTSQIFKMGDVYTVDQLVKHYDIKIDPQKHYATKRMIKYAGNIARDLNIEPPDFSNAKETHSFIKNNKDKAYLVREKRRKEREEKQRKKSPKKKGAKNKTGTWYKNTLYYMQDNTEPGYRFSSMKALAIIAFKEKVPREVFMSDLKELAAYWTTFDWKGDNFNQKNIEAIERLFDEAVKYSNTSSETLEEWLGYEFKRIRNRSRKDPLTQEEHLEIARGIRDIRMKQLGQDWRNNEGAPTKQEIVEEWRKAHPDGKKMDCHRDTGLSRTTIDKWWNGKTGKKATKVDQPVAEQEQVDIQSAEPSEEPEVSKEVLELLMNMSDEQRAKFFKWAEEYKE